MEGRASTGEQKEHVQKKPVAGWCPPRGGRWGENRRSWGENGRRGAQASFREGILQTRYALGPESRLWLPYKVKWTDFRGVGFFVLTIFTEL